MATGIWRVLNSDIQSFIIMYSLSLSIAKVQQKVAFLPECAIGPPLHRTNLGHSISFVKLIFLSIFTLRALQVFNLLEHGGGEKAHLDVERAGF